MQITGDLIECRQVDRLEHPELVLPNEEKNSTVSSFWQGNTIKTRPKVQPEYTRGILDEVR